MESKTFCPLLAVSPIDGRYANQSECLRDYFSEYALIKHRIIVEIKWFEALFTEKIIEDTEGFDDSIKEILNKIISEFTVDEAEKVKEIESTTNHDVKAVEYYLKNKFDETEFLKKRKEFLHFTCTSEDINNLSYAMMVNGAIKNVMLPSIESLIKIIKNLAHEYSDIPMMSRTHNNSSSDY